MKDESHAKAIIRRGITDYEIIVEKDVNIRIDRIASARSTTRFYDLVEKAADSEFRYSLITKTQFQRHGRRRIIYYFYLDLFSAFEQRKKYCITPTVFDIRFRYIDTKKNPIFISDDDFSFFRLAFHCIQRIIQRHDCNSLIEALSLFSPICFEFSRLSTLSITNRMSAGRYAVVIQNGYFILESKFDETPIILTWVPKSSFNQKNLLKFENLLYNINLVAYAFTTDYFNSNDLIDPKRAILIL